MTGSGRKVPVAGGAGPVGGRRALVGWGALVVLLGTAFVALTVDPTGASVVVGRDRARSTEVVRSTSDPVTRPAPSQAFVLEAPDPADDAIVRSEAAPVAGPPVVVPLRPVVPAAPLVASGMRVRVARLGIDLPVLLGDTARDTVLSATPSGAAFLLPGTTPPGTGGNSYIYAHARAGMFLALWNIRLGDVVEATTNAGELRRYVVTEIHPRVIPTDIEYTLPTADERITLQTSTGPDDSDPRFIVVAVRGG